MQQELDANQQAPGTGANADGSKPGTSANAVTSKPAAKTKADYGAIMRNLMSNVREYKRYSVATPLLVLGEVICEMAIPFLTASLIDQIKV